MIVGAETTAGGLDDVKAKVFVDGGPASGEVIFHDKTAPGGRTLVLGLPEPAYAIYNARFAVDGGPQLVYTVGLDKYTIQASDFADTVRIDAAPAAATQGVYVFGNSGNDTVKVGTPADGLANIAATVRVTGGAGTSDHLIIDDVATQAAKVFQVYTNKVVRTGGPTIYNDDTLLRTLKAGPGGNTVQVLGNTTGESDLAIEAGAGNDTVRLASAANKLSDIQGKLTLSGQAHTTGKDIVEFVDTGFTAGATYTIKASAFAATSSASLILTYTGFEGLSLSSGSGVDTVVLNGVTASVGLTINTGSARDTVQLLAGVAYDPTLSNVEVLDIDGGEYTSRGRD